MAQNNSTGETGLSNDDFRKILFTPGPGGTKPNLAKQAAERKKKYRKPPAPATLQHRPRQLAKKDTEQDEGGGDDDAGGSKYRDRAAERRMGLAVEESEEADVTAAAASALSYDESKFLGGDVQHTHLVKGLDFALLNKLRAEQEKMKGGHEGGEGAAVSVPNRKKESVNEKPPAFSGPLGRAVYNILMSSSSLAVKHTNNAPEHSQQNLSERFLPRRTAFIFDLHTRTSPSIDMFQVPTTLSRAKEDCPAPPTRVDGSSDRAVIDRLSKILSYLYCTGGDKKIDANRRQQLVDAGLLEDSEGLHGGQRRKKEKAKEVEAIVMKPPVDEDEDIFADAGTDYVVEKREKEPVGGPVVDKGEKNDAGGGGGYFEGGKGGTKDEEELPPIAQPMIVSEEQKKKKKKRKAVSKIIKQQQQVEGGEEGGYEECYPSYYDAAGMVYDSEDDDGRGFAKEAKNEEEGGGDGKGGKKKAEAEKREAIKEQNKQKMELQRLQKIFEEKGYGKADAFGDDDDEGGGGKHGGGGINPAPHQKKRRI